MWLCLIRLCSNWNNLYNRTTTARPVELMEVRPVVGSDPLSFLLLVDRLEVEPVLEQEPGRALELPLARVRRPLASVLQLVALVVAVGLALESSSPALASSPGRPSPCT